MAITGNRYLTLVLLFAAAAISYAVGFTAGFVTIIAVGGIFELAFWFALFIRRRRDETRR